MKTHDKASKPVKDREETTRDLINKPSDFNTQPSLNFEYDYSDFTKNYEDLKQTKQIASPSSHLEKVEIE